MGVFVFFRHARSINVIVIVLFMMANPSVPVIVDYRQHNIDATTTTTLRLLHIRFNIMYGL
jgi:hypothetical protein